MTKRLLSIGSLVCFMFGLLSAGSRAEPLDYFLIKGVSYDQSVLKPAEVFGHDIGDQPLRHDLFVSYIRRLAEKSPRMQVETIGYSHEKRPILFITVTSPENHARLDAIKTAHVARSNPATADMASDDLPVVTWLNYGVHGAEASGMDAAIPTLYHLAAAEDQKTKDQLDNSVVLITAVFNPDGHARRANWVTGYGSNVRSIDGNHEIHNQMWPGGRTNHYWFDLNRQWLLQTQPESRAWLTKWHEWKPQVSADFHEMGANSSYYFHPGDPARKYPLIPAKGRELLVEIAGYHTKWLDSEGKLYFTEEDFDNYYIGKGSTYPQVNGSLGILFEAGAQMGVARKGRLGIKTYAENIQTHFGTSLSTIEGAAAMRGKLHDYQRNFFAEANKLAKTDKVKGYVFRAPEDTARMDTFLDLLARHQVKTYRVSGSVKAGDATYGEESFIVPMDQPQYRMAKSLFNRITEFPSKVFYDVSGWTLPLAYGLEYGEVTSGLRGKLGAEAVGTSITVSVPDQSDYAYMFRWSDYYAPKAVNALLQQGIMVRATKKPTTVVTSRGTVEMTRGAIIVQKHLQTVDSAVIDAVVKKLALENGLTVHAVKSGHTLNVGADIGGRNSVADLTAPKPLLITGPGVSPYDAGEVWHLLDHKMKMPVTLVRKERFKNVDLRGYTHIILVGGSGGFSEKDTGKIKDWVKAGGTFVAHRQGAKWAAEKLRDAKGKKTDLAFGTEPRLAYADKGQKDAEHVIGGALFESVLDITHPMAFGIVRDRIATNRNTSIKLENPKDPYARVAIYSDQPLLSGYTSPERIEDIKGTPMMTAERMGRGSVILFADNPNFRATYLGAEKLFINSLFFSRAFSNAYTSDEAMEAHAHEE